MLMTFECGIFFKENYDHKFRFAILGTVVRKPAKGQHPLPQEQR